MNAVGNSIDLLKSGKLDLTAADAGALAADILNGPAIDTRDRLHNRFFHEFLPLVTIAQVVGQSVANRVSFTAVEHGFDGQFTSTGGEVRRVELTAAIDGQDEALRMEMLARFGEAPAFGNVRAIGTKHKRILIRSQSCGGRVDEYDHGYLLPLMQKRLKAKVAGAAKREAYQGAWLGIVFDDYAAIESRRCLRFDPLCRLLLTESSSIAPFERLFCVGITGAYVFDSKTLAGWLLPPLGR